jgi:hypothetical protein
LLELHPIEISTTWASNIATVIGQYYHLTGCAFDCLDVWLFALHRIIHLLPTLFSPLEPSLIRRGLDLQVVVYVSHAGYLPHEIFRPRFLFLGSDHAI